MAAPIPSAQRDAPAPFETPELLAGYRIIRTLGRSERAVVYLATPGESGEQRALKVYGRGTLAATIDTEIGALERARGDHVVELVDLSTGNDGLPVLVLSRVTGPSVSRLLADRGDIAVGEAITLLAPVAATVARLHDVGVVHSAIRASAVLIDDRGAPVLCCFGAAELIAPHSPIAAREVDPGVRRDNEGLATLVAATLAHVADARFSSGVDALHEWMRSAIYEDPAGFALGVEGQLFELADAIPLRHRSQLGARAAPGSTSVPTASATSGLLAQNGTGEHQSGSGYTSVVSSRVTSRVTSLVTGAWQSTRTHLSTVRPRFWIAAAAAVVAATTALALSGYVSTEGETDSTARRANQSEAPRSDTLDAASSGSPQVNSFAASAEQPQSQSEAGSAEVRRNAISGDDPVAAVGALLRERATCFVELSLTCLDAVDQFGSIALESDREAIEFVRDGGELPTGFGMPASALAPTLTQRLGDSALVALGAQTPPASALIVRSEAGWRIRELLAS